MAHYELNEERNGVEIYFDSIPSDEVRAELREGRWRWFKAKKCWYTRQSDEAIAFAKRVCGNAPVVSTQQTKQASTPTSNMGYIMPEMNKRYCYADTITNFLGTQESEWISEMKNGFSEAYMLALGDVQIGGWKDCYRVLKRVLPKFNQEHPNFHIVFEYSLPYESGRRPDVILVSNEFVIILEFKKKNNVFCADIDQTVAYARDIEEYHYETRGRNVSAILVVTEMTGEYYDEQTISVCSADLLNVALDDSLAGKTTACDIDLWINSKYEPLPTIVEAARMIMKKEQLPNIRKVNSTGIPEAIQLLEKTTEYAKKNGKHILALVTGVPGAGKTFLGLQFVYNICEDDHAVNSVYLSGNGPLVQVLTNALGSNVFVKDLHKVENEYKEYCQVRYEGNMEKRYGLLQSSKAWNLRRFGVYSQFRPNCGAWYNTPVGSGNSCCDLKIAISEFDCQGLELDMPIVCWGTDMCWNGSSWDLFDSSEPADSDANTYRKNSYRVLLTRGRDGFIVYIPDDRKLDGVYDLFDELGIVTL